MTCLLDTNACIAILNGEPQGVRRRLRSVLTRGESVTASSIALFEHWYGVAESARTAAANTERLAVFLAPLGTLPFDDDDARAAGAVRAGLERARAPIGAYDTLLAGQGIRRLALVTANVVEFARGQRAHLAELGRVSTPSQLTRARP